MIEALMALEKELRAECPSYCGPDVTYQVDAAAVWALADKLAAILATASEQAPVELGQEVGAVAGLTDAVRMLLDSAPAHMTPRNAKEREAYKLLRSIMKELN